MKKKPNPLLVDSIPVPATNAFSTKLKRRSSFGDYPSLLEGVNKWRTPATAKLVQRLWVRPLFGKTAERSEAGNPVPLQKRNRAKHYILPNYLNPAFLTIAAHVLFSSSVSSLSSCSTFNNPSFESSTLDV